LHVGSRRREKLRARRRGVHRATAHVRTGGSTRAVR
jgi:hypothetical protein